MTNTNQTTELLNAWVTAQHQLADAERVLMVCEIAAAAWPNSRERAGRLELAQSSFDRAVDVEAATSAAYRLRLIEQFSRRSEDITVNA